MYFAFGNKMEKQIFQNSLQVQTDENKPNKQSYPICENRN